MILRIQDFRECLNVLAIEHFTSDTSFDEQSSKTHDSETTLGIILLDDDVFLHVREDVE